MTDERERPEEPETDNATEGDEDVTAHGLKTNDPEDESEV
jgi:hypothetical protein